MKKINSILLIDDDEISNFLCKETIKLSNVAKDVIDFVSADDALEYLSKIDQKNFPDLIFLDINMPGMDGWEFLENFERLRCVPKRKVSVVLLSSSKYNIDVAKSMEFTEIAEFVTKPLTIEALFSILNKYSKQNSKASTYSLQTLYLQDKHR